MSDKWVGKVIVVTGASGGIGEDIAVYLSSLGARLVLGARRKENLQKVVDRITTDGGNAIYHVTDVTKPHDVVALVQSAVQAFGRVDIIINNAGAIDISPLEALKIDEWNRMIDVNFKGLLHGIAAGIPQFKAQKSGHFVNISSVAGFKVFTPGGVVYSATKQAINAVSEGLRQEMAPYGIRVTTICPGTVQSDLIDFVDREDCPEILKNLPSLAIPARSISRAVQFAIEQPEDVSVGEIVVRPTQQLF